MTVSLLPEFVDWNSRCSNSNETTLVGFCTVICILGFGKRNLTFIMNFNTSWPLLREKGLMPSLHTRPSYWTAINLIILRNYFPEKRQKNCRENKLDTFRRYEEEDYRNKIFSMIRTARAWTRFWRENVTAIVILLPVKIFVVTETCYQMLSFIILRSWES